MPAAVAIPAAIGAAGVGASIYGADKTSKATKDAAKANMAATEAANERNYQMWLQSRGVGTNGRAVNTKLPQWATWNSSKLATT